MNALEGIKVDTRRFARRQRTWLRAIADVHWHSPTDESGILERVAAFLGAADSEPRPAVDAPPTPA